jgi:hypothetical protein
MHYKLASDPNGCWQTVSPQNAGAYPSYIQQFENMCLGENLVYFTDLTTGANILFGVSPNGTTPPTDFTTYCGIGNPAHIIVTTNTFQEFYFNLSNNSSGYISC